MHIILDPEISFLGVYSLSSQANVSSVVLSHCNRKKPDHNINLNLKNRMIHESHLQVVLSFTSSAIWPTRVLPQVVLHGMTSANWKLFQFLPLGEHIAMPHLTQCGANKSNTPGLAFKEQLWVDASDPREKSGTATILFIVSGLSSRLPYDWP